MYENVQQPKLKSNRTLWILIAAVTVVFIAVILILWWPFEYMDNFQSFVGYLSNSTVDAYDGLDGLYAHTQEGRVRILGDNIHLVYFIIANAGAGRVCDRPIQEPEAVLYYSDGAIMELWDIPATEPGSIRSKILCISYVNPEGERYTYNTDHLDLGRLPLSKQANLPEKLKDLLKEQETEST